MHKILVVEDDPTLQLVTQRALVHLGHECIMVGSGEAAVEAHDPTISLIFMDVGLPGMDGTRATLLIRERELREHRPRTPIVALTGHADREKCVMAGMDDYLQKPVLMGDLQKMIQKWCPVVPQ